MKYPALAFASLLLVACQHPPSRQPLSEGHLKAPSAPAAAQNIPKPVSGVAPLPAPEPMKKELTLTAVVKDVPLDEFLFSITRDTQLNLDMDQDVEGTVTMNAVNQTLEAILERVAETANIRYSLKNNTLRIRKDTPFLRNYRIDYLNMSRKSEAKVSVSTQISSTGRGAAGDDSGGGGETNNSTTGVSNSSHHVFWESLQGNIANIIADSDSAATAAAGEGTGANASGGNRHIMVNAESGIISVRATQAQHREIQAFLDEVLTSVKRQVLIEATIAEVKLSDRYQAGIDWSLLQNSGTSQVSGGGTFTSITLAERPTLSLNFSDLDVDGNLLQATLSALQTFGDVRIMSSPKVMALNNQTALLKVVDNLVYFTTDVTIEAGSATGGVTVQPLITYETEINTVPVGFVMSVTPYINEHNSVTLNVRPTISRVVDRVRDPNPDLARVNVVNEIPVIQVREVESVLKVSSGDIAVIGGLMQDESSDQRWGIPFLSKLPFVGGLFRYDDDRMDKTELVIFIKPVVVNHASVNGDLNDYLKFLPADGD